MPAVREADAAERRALPAWMLVVLGGIALALLPWVAPLNLLDDISARWRGSLPNAGSAWRSTRHLVPTFGRATASLSAMRRDSDTPNGLMEFLVARGIELLRGDGVAEVSLNFAAFARVLHSPGGPGERLLGRAVALAKPYFQIESLYRFNAKFFPRWEPRYLLYEGACGLPRAGLAAMRIEGQPSARRA
jgi:hypothetical protein